MDQQAYFEVPSKMLIFDMDNTLLKGRFIDNAALRFGFSHELDRIRKTVMNPSLRTAQIAEFLKGAEWEEILAVIAAIPVIPDAAEVIQILKGRGYVTGIISDSYDCVTQFVKEKLGMDFALSNKLEMVEGRATGRVSIPTYFRKKGGSFCGHDICKSYAVRFIAQEYGITPTNIVAVGDSENDVCMIKYASVGIAFCSREKLLLEIADYRIKQRSFKELLSFIK